MSTIQRTVLGEGCGGTSVSDEFKSLVDRAKAVPIESEARRRGLSLTRVSRVSTALVGPCPRCLGNDRFSVNPNPPKQSGLTRTPYFHCRNCRQGGDVIALTMFIDRCDFVSAVRTLTGNRPSTAAHYPTVEKIEKNHAETRPLWPPIWSGAGKIERTSTYARYLASRGLEVLPDAESVRGHPQLWHADSKRSAIGLVALFRDIRTDEPCGIHRTFLNGNGNKFDRKMLGRVRGAAIKLDPDETVTSGLFVGEGLETCLAAQLAGFKPVWCLGSAGGIASFPVLCGIEAISVLGEVDDNGANDRAARACASRWIEAGNEAFIIAPLVGKDMNDVWRAAS